MGYMVIRATTITAENRSSKSAFASNATGFATHEEARAEAKRRNEVEREAGNTNVEWCGIEELPTFEKLAAMMKKGL